MGDSLPRAYYWTQFLKWRDYCICYEPRIRSESLCLHIYIYPLLLFLNHQHFFAIHTKYFGLLLLLCGGMDVINHCV